MSKIYTDLNTVLTPYATAIKKNASDIDELNGSLESVIVKGSTIDISGYTKIPFNLEKRTIWEANGTYGCILIPAEDLPSKISFSADTLKVAYAFLKSDSHVAGQRPDFCDGISTTTIIPVGSEENNVDIPSDCEYLYLYISSYTPSTVGIRVLENAAYAGSLTNTLIKELKEATIKEIEDQYAEKILRTIKHRNDGVGNSFTHNNVSDDLLVLAHISDVHTDVDAYTRFIKFLKDHKDTINAGVVSGDLVDTAGAATYAMMIACEDSDVSLIKCVGNHEKDGSTDSEYIYTNYNLDTNTGKNYYYVDFPQQKIRVICLYQYDLDTGTTAQKGATAHYSQQQIDWFINTLQDSITNEYSVIVVGHGFNEAGFPTFNDKGFCQHVTYNMNGSPSGTIISDIVNAYKHGLTLNKSYTATDTQAVLNVDTTFGSAGEFVCYMSGHYHVDYIGYSTLYNDQLMCFVQGSVINSRSRTEANAKWQSAYDTPRVEGTPTENSINIYGIDTKSKLLKVAKLGSTLTDKFVERKYAVFEY